MSGYAPAPLIWLGQQMEDLIPSAVVSGIVAGPDSGDSYHQAAKDLPASSYTRQLEADRIGIDVSASCALDVSMSTADMKVITGRVYRSWQDPDDPRLNEVREVIGTLDGRNVIYMDCQSGEQGSADDSHLWHLHSGGLRRYIITMPTVRALLSVIKGETYQQFLATSGGTTMSDFTPLQPPAAIKLNGVVRGDSLGIWDVWGHEMLGHSPYGPEKSYRGAQLDRIEAYAKAAAAATAVTLDPATIQTLAQAIATALPQDASAHDIAAELIAQLGGTHA